MKRKLDVRIDEEKLDEMQSDLLAAEREIEKELEKKLKRRHGSQIVVDTESLLYEKPAKKTKKSFVMPNLGLDDQDADSNVLDIEELAQSQEFLNKEVLKGLITSTNKEKFEEKEQCKKIAEQQTPLSKFETYRPTLESLGISTAASGSCAIVSTIVPDKSLNHGELDLDGISDDEIDR
uniref:Uncharacterized protein n=1 Tax=Romanomermis culicivorax TaxID=13658 RepID=A0A915IK31_ROMCU